MASQTIGTGGTDNEGLNGTSAGTNNTLNDALVFDTDNTGVAQADTAIGSIRLTSAEAIVIGGNTPANAGFTAGSLALGAQAGEARIREVVEAGGFTRFRRVAETPFNLVFEARP